MKFLINAFFKAKKIAAKMVDSFAASNMAQIAKCHVCVCWCPYVCVFWCIFGIFNCKYLRECKFMHMYVYEWNKNKYTSTNIVF